MAFSRRSPLAAAASRRSPLRRVAAVGFCAACLVALQATSTAFAPTLTRPAVLDGPATSSDKRPARRAEESASQEHPDEGARDVKAVRNATLQNDAVLGSTPSGTTVSLSPPWATCFVTGQADGRSMLKEWTIRGDSQTMGAFRAFMAQEGEGDVTCMEAKHAQDDEMMCLECLSFAASASPAAGAVATVQTTLVSTFVSAEQCLTSAMGEPGFCKSGQVHVPM